MQAWQVHELGEPKDVLTFEEVETPRAAGGEILVRVRAVAANFPDALLCRGHYQVKPSLPFSPGIEGCGEVSEVGDGVTAWSVGDRVIGSPEFPTGGFAEYAVLMGAKAFPAPASLDDAEAASLLVRHLSPGAHRDGRRGDHQAAHQ